jgi:hypothetical protein
MLDDESSASVFLTNMKQLLSYKPVMVTGSTASNFCESVQASVTRAKVPLSCAFVDISQVHEKYVYGLDAQEVQTAQPIANFLESRVKTASPKIAFVIFDSSGAIEGAHKTASVLEADGWTQSDFAIGAPDTGPTAAQDAAAAATDPNVIYADDNGPGTDAMVQQLRTDGYTGIVISQTPDYPGLLNLKDPNYYSLSSDLFVGNSPTGSGAQLFAKDLKSVGVTGAQNLNGTLVSLDWIRAVDTVAALKKCVATNDGSCNGSEMDAALDTTTISIPGLISEFGYTHNHIGVNTAYFYGYNAAKNSVRLLSGPNPLGSL